MAGDTRESSSPPLRGPPPGATEPPEHVENAKTYEVFPASANSLPEGSGQNTAGRPQNPNLTDAVKTVRIQDFKQVYMYPCVRESLLTGIGGGFAMGFIRAICRAPIPKAANWAVGTFAFAALANYEFCNHKRMLEKSHMKRAVEIIDRKKAAKEAEAKAKREERRRLKEEADNKAEAKKSSWKFW
ncbi:Cytochrome c oxidase protein 20, mitochondrial [Lachnellula occidentalis]|uniref:Cytochrome c oxidase assembly protein COX20, mitochondrial n=1 Tax=Lachnellula occidentalis TaxID=215460 RepID=A0A8H8RXI3_9HELO|nr:Cytochrome c oxidase protein 20, mitochondrial [Lachnellula occidentalis]